jgi:hypothetical protein
VSHLVAHPWDDVARPPVPGGSYPTDTWKDQEARIERLVKEAEHYDGEAERAREKADDNEVAAEDRRDEAQEVIDNEIAPTDPEYARVLYERFGL